MIDNNSYTCSFTAMNKLCNTNVQCVGVRKSQNISMGIKAHQEEKCGPVPLSVAHPCCVCVCPQQPVKEVLPLPRQPSPLPVTSSSLTPAAISKKPSPGSIQHVQVASSGDQQTESAFCISLRTHYLWIGHVILSLLIYLYIIWLNTYWKPLAFFLRLFLLKADHVNSNTIMKKQ